MNQSDSSVPKIFISYANEDRQQVMKLGNALAARGIRVWVDYQSILPGENWENKVADALQYCEYTIICLSKKALTQPGYFQKEYKIALERQQNLSDRDVYIIPVRLDDCEVPREITKIHHVDLFDDWADGIEKIQQVVIKMALQDVPPPEVPPEAPRDNNLPHVVIVMGRCSYTKQAFGMRYEEMESGLWVVDWAFPIKETVAKKEGYHQTTISGVFKFTDSFPGCPYCHSHYFFHCRCGKIACCDETPDVYCPWCMESGQIEQGEGSISMTISAGEDHE